MRVGASGRLRYAVVMKIEGQTVLITGGSSGIGLALASAWSKRGARVLACGRSAAKLAAAARLVPGLVTVEADVATPTGRERLCAEVTRLAPGLTVLVNNAAVQHPAEWVRHHAPEQATRAAEEVALNIGALVALTHALLPRLQAAPEAAVVNLSSGLALAPKKSSPVYCASKAFVGSFTRALRYQCEDHAPHVRVVDVLPPLVDTPMTAGRGRAKIAPAAVAEAILAGLARDRSTIDVGAVRLLRGMQRLVPTLAYRITRDW